MAKKREKPPSDAAPGAADVPAGLLFSVSLLGHPRFAYGDGAFAFPSFRKTLPLLAYLATRDAPVDRDALAFLFWPDDEEETALANLRRNLYLLHGHLPPQAPETPWIISEGTTLQWNRHCRTRIDVEEFSRACDERRLTEAVQIYRGDLLENLYDEWVLPERERLRRRFEDAARVLISEHRSRREFGAALGYADRLLAKDPWREDLVRVSIAMRYESGDRAGALQAFRQFARDLREEMDVDPMPETVALRDAIVDDADVGRVTGLDVPARAAPSAPPVPADLPFVGRAVEFARLRALYDRAIAGEGGACGLCGEAGIGKTRAVTELVRLAEGHGTRVLIGTTSSPESVPYQAFVTALRPMVPLLAKSRIAPIWLATLASLLPSLGSLRSDLPALDLGDDRRDRQRLYEGLAVAFEELARARPLLVILEDLHWAGTATIDAFSALRERLGERRVCFVATFRDEGTEAATPVRALRRASDPLETIALGRLPRTAIAELAGARLTADLASAEVERLFDRAEGHPLFLLDLIACPQRDDEGGLPPAIDAAIERRLASVDPDCQLYLDIAATIGATFDLDTIVAVAGGSEREADRAFDALIARNTIRRTSRRSGADFAFTHHLIHRVAYRRVDERSRARFHRRVASFLSEREGARSAAAATIGHHFEAGGERERAAEAFLHAAGRAERLAANADAIGLAERALGLTGEARLRIALLFALERLAVRGGEIEKRAAFLAGLRAHVEASGTPSDSAELLLRELTQARERADRARELEIIDRLHRLADGHDEPALSAVVARARADQARSADRFDLCVPYALEALALYRAANDPIGVVDVLTTLGHAYSMLGRNDDADRTLEEAAALVRADSTPGFEARFLLSRAMTLLARQRYTEAVGAARQSAELFAESGDLPGEAVASNHLGTALNRLRHFEEARAAFERAYVLNRAIGAPRLVAGSLVNSAMVTINQHDYHRAEESLDEAVAIFTRTSDVRGLGIAQTNRTFVLLQLDRPVEGEAAARAALEILEGLHLDYIRMSAMSNLASALYEQGRYAEALAPLEVASAYHRTHDRAIDLADAIVYEVMARVDTGDLEGAKRSASELEALIACGGPGASERYLAFWALARCAHACGDTAEAARLLAQAETEACERENAAADEAGRALAAGRRFVREIRAASANGIWPAPPV